MRLEQGIGAVCLGLGALLVYSAFGSRYILALNAVAGIAVMVMGVSIILLEKKVGKLFKKKEDENRKILEERWRRAQEYGNKVFDLGSSVAVAMPRSNPGPIPDVTPTPQLLQPEPTPAQSPPAQSAFDMLFQEIFAKHIQTEVDLTFELPATESVILGKTFKVSGKIRVRSKKEREREREKEKEAEEETFELPEKAEQKEPERSLIEKIPLRTPAPEPEPELEEEPTKEPTEVEEPVNEAEPEPAARSEQKTADEKEEEGLVFIRKKE